MRRRAGLVATLVALAVAGGSERDVRAQATAGEQKAAAEILFEQGHALVERGDYRQACPKYAESLRLDPGIGVMLHLASCWEKLGKPASAWAQYREAEQVAVRAGDTRSEVARKRAEALEGRLYRLTIDVPAAAVVDGLAVARDGEPVGRAQWGAAVPIDPGEHTIVAVAPGKERWEGKVVTPDAAGASAVAVPVLGDASPSRDAPPPPPPPTSAPAGDDGARSTGWGGQRIAAVAVGAAGVVGVGIGAYFGILTKQKLDDSNSSGCLPDNHCNAAGAALRSDAQSAGRASTIAFSVGLAALAGGAVLWLTAPSPAAPRVGAAVGPEGGGVVVRGVW